MKDKDEIVRVEGGSKGGREERKQKIRNITKYISKKKKSK